MSSAGQPIDPVVALAAQAQASPAPYYPPGDSRNNPAAVSVTPQTIDPVEKLAAGPVDAPTAQSGTPMSSAPVSTWADIVRSIPGGIAKGVAGIAGLPGDVSQLLDIGMDAITGAKIADAPHPGRFTSQDINNTISKPFGGYYQPQTMPGQYAETAASFAPNALAPGTMAQKLARVLVPAGTSESAGQLTKGTAFEPMARAAGALTGGIAQGAGENALFRNANPAPSLEDLAKLKGDAYKAADAAGVVISPKSFQQFAADAGSNLTRDNVVQADIHPNTMAALSILHDEAGSGAPISLARADAIRKAIGGAAEKAAGPAGSKDDLRLVTKIKGSLDDYLDKLTPADTLSGDPETAVPILKGARDLAQREFKGKLIQQFMDLAKNSASTNYSASGYEQALRAQFKNFNAQLIKNPSMANGFSDAERAAIENVAKGSALGNALRYVGKFSAHGPVSAGAGMGIGALLGSHVGAGAAEGGMAGAILVPSVGELGRTGATALTNRNAQMAGELMRSGKPVSNMVNPGASGLAALLLSHGAH